MVVGFIISIILMGFGIRGFYLRSVKNTRCTFKTTATIIENEERVCKLAGSNPEIYMEYTPIISYNFNGEDYRRVCYVGSGSSRKKLGKIVDIYINKDDPKEVFIPKWQTPSLISSSLFLLSGLLLAQLLLLYR